MKKIMLPALAMLSVYAMVYMNQQLNNSKTPIIKLITKTHKLAGAASAIKIQRTNLSDSKTNTKCKTGLPKQTKSTLKSFIQPPIPSRNIEYASYVFDANKGIQVTYDKTGTVITIPPHCFIDKNGNQVTGKAKLNYREFNKPSEIFLCGIPMQWSKTEYLESGGMLDINVVQDDKPVTIMPGKSIEIAMHSKFTDDDYNLYKFDEQTGKWIDLGKSYEQKVLASNTSSTENRDISSQTITKNGVAITRSETVALQNMIGFTIDMDDEYRADDQAIYRYASLTINGNLKHFPELKKLNQRKYRITSHTYSELLKLGFAGEKARKLFPMNNPTVRNNKFYKDTINGRWPYHDVTLMIPGSKGMADLIFINSERSDTFGVLPSVKGKTEQKKFMKRYESYASMVDTCSRNRSNFQTSQVTLFKNISEIDENSLSETELNNLKRFKKELEVERRFNITDLTYYNCDRPFPITPSKMYMADFTERENPNSMYGLIYCAFTDRNSIIALNTFYYHFTKFTYYLWAVKDENTVAYLTPDDIKQIYFKFNKINTIKLKTMPMDEFLNEMDRVILNNVQSKPMI